MGHVAPDGDTIVAIATAPGKSAIGIVRVSGDKALQIAETITGKHVTIGQIQYAAFHAEDGSAIDSGLLLSFQRPASYTGEDLVEFQTHGSQPVLQALLQEVIRCGARHARPGEFTERAYLNNKLDLLQAEAVADLINSNSRLAARSASQSLQGRFSDEVNDLLQQITWLRVYVEGALDFPEEEVDFLKNEQLLVKLKSCIESAEKLLSRCEQGRSLGNQSRVVIAGRPNAGKSSLMNQLVGIDAAIVSEISGTTRDLIEQEVMLGGISLRLFDTAGIRDASDPIEVEGVARAEKAIQNADLVIVVREPEEKIMMEIPEEADQLVVINKIDLSDIKPEVIENDPVEIYLSAKTGDGIELLINMIEKKLYHLEAGQSPLLARDRHILAIEKAVSLLRQGLGVLQEYGSGELLAEDLHQAHDSLSVLTGRIVADDLLGEIFSRFCIGK